METQAISGGVCGGVRLLAERVEKLRPLLGSGRRLRNCGHQAAVKVGKLEFSDELQGEGKVVVGGSGDDRLFGFHR